MERVATSVSRRNILLGLAGAAVAAVVSAPIWQPTAGQRTRRLLAGNSFTRRFLSLDHAEQAEWEALSGSVFTAGGGYRLRLAGVRPLPSSGVRPPEAWRAGAFVAVFEVLNGMTMRGDVIHNLSHSQYGHLPVFLTASSDAGRMLAVFN
jgi:hypothetical protein